MSAQHRQVQGAVIGRQRQLLRHVRYLQQAQPARAPGGALHHAGGFQRLEVVLRGTHAAEAEGTRDFRLRGRHAFGVDAVGDEGVDGALGIGQAHG